MLIFLFISLTVAVIAVLFALQNTAVVEINFLFWSFEGSLALVLLIALALGAIISFFASLPSVIRLNRTTRSQGKQIGDLETRLTEKEKLLDDAQARIAELEKPPAALEAPEEVEETPPANAEENSSKSLWRS